MTIDEAIKDIKDNIKPVVGGKSLDMAIEALEQAKTNCLEIPNNSDTISRQQAIDALRKMQTYKLFAGDDMLLINQAEAQTELMMLPSAQPEREKGKWIQNDNGTYSCSLCQSWIPEEQHYYARFCLYCGADMRGEEHEIN